MQTHGDASIKDKESDIGCGWVAGIDVENFNKCISRMNKQDLEKSTGMIVGDIFRTGTS